MDKSIDILINGTKLGLFFNGQSVLEPIKAELSLFSPTFLSLLGCSPKASNHDLTAREYFMHLVKYGFGKMTKIL